MVGCRNATPRTDDLVCPALPPDPPPTYRTCGPDTPAGTLALKAMTLVWDPTSGPRYGCQKMRGVYPTFPDIDPLITTFVDDFSGPSSASHGRVCIDIVERHDMDGLPPTKVQSLDGPDGPMIRNYEWVSRDAYFRNLEHAISRQHAGKSVEGKKGGRQRRILDCEKEANGRGRPPLRTPHPFQPDPVSS
jgi:hypothetical protein